MVVRAPNAPADNEHRQQEEPDNDRAELAGAHSTGAAVDPSTCGAALASTAHPQPDAASPRISQKLRQFLCTKKMQAL